MKVAVAFSGGLDTCWCIPVLRAEGHEVLTVAVDVGGWSAEEVAQIESRSQLLGAAKHFTIPAADLYFEEVLRVLLAGNVLRGGVYPLCVGAERSLQASVVARIAKEEGCSAIAHGCTAAGNDQIRFEIALRTLAPGLDILAPVRDQAPTRPEQLRALAEAGLSLSAEKAAYSINSGLWGVTIGGVETSGTRHTLPEHAWMRTKGAFDSPKPLRDFSVDFDQGVPVAVDEQLGSPVDLIKKLDALVGAYGFGRGVHLGETILGIKGRVAFEAPAALALIHAHRELEKLVLTKRQIQLKDHVAQFYGEWVHEGLITDPASSDARALLLASQKRVTGRVYCTLSPGNLMVTGVESPYSLHAASKATYGEAVGEWEPQDAYGFSKLYGLSGILHARVGGES